MGWLSETRIQQDGEGRRKTQRPKVGTRCRRRAGWRSAATAAASTCARQCVGGPTPAGGACRPAAVVEPPPPPDPPLQRGLSQHNMAYSKRVQSAATRPVFVGCRGCGLQQRALLFLYHPARPPLCTRRPPLDCLNVKRTPERMTSFQLLGGWRAGAETPRDGWLVDVSL